MWEEQRPWNVYHYSANNPIVAKDPDGKHPIVAIAVIAIAYFLSSPNVAVAPTRGTQGDKAKVEQAKRNSQQNAAIVTTTALTGGGALSIASGLATGGEVSAGKGLLKSGNNAKSGSNAAGGKKGSTDYVVTPDGVTVPKDQKVMRDGFDRAGYPSRPSEKSEPGVIHTVNTTNGKIDVRTMEGNAHHGKRAVITHPNTSSPKTPSGKATTNKSDNHIKQH